MDKNYYDVLGLSKNATDKEIKSQFYKLSKQYHPDVNPNGEEKFKEINEAYSVLGDKVKRKEYDSPKINIDDMFFNNPFFSGDMFNPHRNDSKASFVQLDVTVTESYTGFTKKIEFNKMINCDYCNGSGGETTTCSACAGQGTQRMNMGNSFFSQTFVTHCNSCNGKGKIITNPCVKCGGKGEVAEKMSFDFVAHRFIKPGNYLIKDGNVESVIVNLRVFNDQFSRENDNLIYNLILRNDEIFANEIYIPHPDGRLILYLPKTYETRKPIRLKGKGFDGGDYYIKIDVAVEK